ncbi:hypothetical protein [Devosia sp. CAU 1758]
MNDKTLPAAPHYNIKREFSLAEVQVIVAGVLGTDTSERHIADSLRPQLENPNSTLSLVKARAGLEVDNTRLLAKIEALAPGKLRALQEAVGRVLALGPSEIFGGGDLPSVHVLRRFDLAPPVAARASAFVVVQLEGGRHVHEIVLHDVLESPGFPQTSVGDAANALVQRVHEARQGKTPTKDTLMRMLALALVLASGHENLRVFEDMDGTVTVFQVPLEALRSDVADRSLRNLVLPGVNAPAGTGRA